VFKISKKYENLNNFLANNLTTEDTVSTNTSLNNYFVAKKFGVTTPKAEKVT
jgi:hypothetical protein